MHILEDITVHTLGGPIFGFGRIDNSIDRSINWDLMVIEFGSFTIFNVQFVQLVYVTFLFYLRKWI